MKKEVLRELITGAESAAAQLKGYQLVGLAWLKMLHQERQNGIVADEMGLGKTIMTISLLQLLQREGDTNAHLIVVPGSTIENWGREFARWAGDISVLVYYGTQKERELIRRSFTHTCVFILQSCLVPKVFQGICCCSHHLLVF